VVGEEVKTTHGEVIGLFIKEKVPPGLSVHETIVRIRDMGGLVGVSHPLDRCRSEAMGLEMLETIREQLDFIEVFNARMTFPSDNRLAQELAARWGLPGSAGSDAHTPFEVGRAFVEMPAFDSPQSFLASLAQGEIHGRLSSPLVHLFSRYAKWRRRWEER
jgi:predicted metal-dependent phosphoesterase TrpH